MDAAIRDRQNVEKEGKMTQSQITAETNRRLDVLPEPLNEADSSKKLTVEGQDLPDRLKMLIPIADLGKSKISLSTLSLMTQEEDLLTNLEIEQLWLSKFKNLNSKAGKPRKELKKRNKRR